MNDLCMVFLSYVIMMIVMVMMIWWLIMLSSMRDWLTWCCCLCLNHLCCISKEYKLSYYLVVLQRMIYITFTYIHECVLVYSHIYFISCIKHQLSLHNARMVHSIHMHCRIQHHHHYHLFLSSSFIDKYYHHSRYHHFNNFYFLFYFHVSSLHYYYRLDRLLSTSPVRMVN